MIIMTHPLVHEINSDMISVGCVSRFGSSSYLRWPFKLWETREKETNNQGPPRDIKVGTYFKHVQL